MVKLPKARRGLQIIFAGDNEPKVVIFSDRTYL